jgi:ribonucleoside-diphosphate reductase alpha chain
VNYFPFDRPYEIFAIENGKYDKRMSKGSITKHSRGNYDLTLEDGTIVKNITKETTEQEDSLTRMVSLSLRHGISLVFIVEQLNKVEGELFCFAKSMARSLKKYIKDGTKSTEVCKKCGDTLVFENGCSICKSCGESKCM